LRHNRRGAAEGPVCCAFTGAGFARESRARRDHSRAKLPTIMSNSARRSAGWWIYVWLPVVLCIAVIALESTEIFRVRTITSGPLRRLVELLFGSMPEARWETIHHYLAQERALPGVWIHRPGVVTGVVDDVAAFAFSSRRIFGAPGHGDGSQLRRSGTRRFYRTGRGRPGMCCWIAQAH